MVSTANTTTKIVFMVMEDDGYGRYLPNDPTLVDTPEEADILVRAWYREYLVEEADVPESDVDPDIDSLNEYDILERLDEAYGSDHPYPVTMYLPITTE